MTTVALEVERKYDVDDRTQVPDLTGVPGVAAVSEPEVVHLVATYVDTADLRLRRAHTTLRHRSGGHDAGWHLKTPVGADRQEVRLPGNDAAAPVPEQLQSLVRVHVRRAALAPVAVLTTVRTVRRLLDADGRVLVELADDVVTGTPVGGVEQTWREWEAELVDGSRELLGDVERELLRTGAEPSASSSKLGRVLGALPPGGGAVPWWAGRPVSSRRVSAGGVVQAHLRAQAEELVRRDPQVRRDVDDAVHRMRVATRRLRSALTSFRVLLDPAATAALREELKWLAGLLGEARDAEVQHARLRELVAGQPAELVVGPVHARVDEVMGRRYREAHQAVVRELDGDRYLALLDALDSLVEAPPFLDGARGRAADVLPGLGRRTWKRLDRRLREAERAEPGHEQDLLLHEARKDAKRARYLGEAVTPVFGRPARRWAKAVAGLQESLGEHQDGVVVRDLLRGLAEEAHRAGESTFTYGRLHALEEGRAVRAASSWPAAREAASERKLRRWLK